MAGTFLDISVHTKDVEQAFVRLQHAAAHMQLVFADIGEYMLRSTDERFREGVDLAGHQWQPLSPEYLARKPKNQDKVLVLSGHLMNNSLVSKPSAIGLLFGSNSIYAATHQFGRDGIPKREFIGLSTADERDILEIIGDYLSGSI